MTAVRPSDPDAAEEATPAVRVVRPERLSGPLIFASPHAGRVYPAALTAASGLDAAALRSSEDAYVDELVAEAAARAGAPLVLCEVARAYVDVNRDPWELDPAMFADGLPPLARSQSPRVAAGLGAIARVVGEGREIYTRKLAWAEGRERIEAVHRPYHAALGALLDEAKGRFGVGVLVDWHSMPSAAAQAAAKRGRPKPDVVLGDRHGAACGRALTATARRAFEACGYVVALNAPYAGGFTTVTYGRPEAGLHALQVELDRSLYLNEATLEPDPEGFARLKADVGRLTEALAREDWAARL